MNDSTIRRRDLLRGLGLGAGALFLPSLGGTPARAPEGDAPRRLIILVSQHQIVGDAWQMLRGNPDATEFEYAFDDPDPASLARSSVRCTPGERNSRCSMVSPTSLENGRVSATATTPVT